MQEDIEQYDYDGGYDYLTDSCQIEDIPSLVRTPSTNQEILELKDVMKFIDQLIGNMGELLNLDADNTYEILMFYNWNKDRIECEYHETILEQLKKQGVFNNHQAICYPDQISMCPLCMEETQLIQLGCRHQFCKSCIQQSIAQRFTKEQFLVIPCLQYGCKYKLPMSMIKNLTKPEDYLKIVCRKFIETNKALAYCQGVDCKKIIKPKDSSLTTVTCPCGTQFCFRCKHELHQPVPCDMAKTWVSEITKNEANIKWIVLNTKICPFCKKPVQRSDGCNYLMCKPPGGCGNAFCYVCSNPWEPDHKDHFKCSKYVPPTNDLEKEKEILARYNFYYERFLNSNSAVEQIQARLKQFREKHNQEIQETYEVTSLEFEFLEEALKELAQSRQVLKWTSCLGYFISQTNPTSSKLFDNYQKEFEHSCEQLGILCMQLFNELEKLQNLHTRQQTTLNQRKNDFYGRREQILKLQNKCYNLRRNLLKASENGDIMN
ncbi:unnamed protein product (macronuclear) [Paramecium tetraurelia]|uniref:RBR-type E3 ubiquitin transferase n=1 Tax=Paramecium tetraurelia TaxID=5888 RepID=A0DMT6_PARTE|nr:uncharacterized protein GSPATT00018557001 [Paramecium tetraurelia]CAK84353.1 unnamed protein product [Paramecium tetraurelia]|eukprot:XP_001451750.1 hypothetical protein (macronuclear) [Paramecium tetraurelia strain d4-2]